MMILPPYLSKAPLAKAPVVALTLLVPLPASAAEEDAILRKASRIITQHRLLSRTELACSTMELGEVTKTVT